MSYDIRSFEYRFYDTPDTYGVARIAIGDVPEELKENPAFDENIFYYCANEEELDMLFDKSNNLDFYLIKNKGE